MGFAVPQAVGRRSVTGEDRVHSQSSPCGFCRGQSGVGAAFSPSRPTFPLSVSFHQRRILLHSSPMFYVFSKWQRYL